MKRVEGRLCRFFFNPVTDTAMFRLQGQEHVYYVAVPKHLSDCDFFVMSRPGDVVAADLDADVPGAHYLVEGWFNETYVMDLN